MLCTGIEKYVKFLESVLIVLAPPKDGLGNLLLVVSCWNMPHEVHIINYEELQITNEEDSRLLHRHYGTHSCLCICDEKCLLYSNPKISHHWLSPIDAMSQRRNPRSTSRICYVCMVESKKNCFFASCYHLVWLLPHMFIVTISVEFTFHLKTFQLWPIHFLQDNAKPHTCNVTTGTIQTFI